MYDRIPGAGKEGRMMIVPEDGSTPYYARIAMADDPIEPGTPISKAALLKDSTAELYGLGPDAVPDDVFKALAAPDYASKLIIHVATADGGSVGNTRVRIRNEELGVYLVKSLDALGNTEFDVMQNHTYYAVLLDYPSQYYGAAALITATGGQVQRETITLPTEPDVIGWRIDESTGTVEYTDGAKNWIPASMVGDTFEPGSLGGSWLFRDIRPCLLKNGVVQYYLDPNDFSKRTDGTDADITSGNDGDVMIEFPLVFYKFYEEINPYGQTWKGCKFSRTQSDDTYCANAYLSEAGIIQQTMYMAAYDGIVLDDKLRSISGACNTASYVISDWRSYAIKNGPGYQQRELCKWSLLQTLFVMMFCSTDSEKCLGKGRYTSGAIAGELNKKGMHWGNQSGSDGVKFCGIEHPWGGKNTICDGIIQKNDDFYFKTHAPYYSLDTTGSKISTGSYDAGGTYWINKMTMHNSYGFLPCDLKTTEGYYHDGFGWNGLPNTVKYPTVGGMNSEGKSGIFSASFSYLFTQNKDSSCLSYTPQGG